MQQGQVLGSVGYNPNLASIKKEVKQAIYILTIDPNFTGTSKYVLLASGRIIPTSKTFPSRFRTVSGPTSVDL